MSVDAKQKETRIINYLVGQVMKRLPGADPRLVKEMVEWKVGEIISEE